jgi:predicted nucleic acid-binding protein
LKKVLVDVNVVLDVLLARAPHAAASTACVAAIEARRVEGFLSGHAVTTLAYLVGRARGKAEARRTVQDLCALFTIAPVDEPVIQRAIVLSLDDFGDAVTAAAAEAAGCEAILTRDAAGFADSPVLGVEPALWLALLAAEAEGQPDSEVHEPGNQTPPRRRVGPRPTRPR